MSERKRWEPLPHQAAFLASAAREVFLGGAAGPGKSEALVIGALRHVDQPRYRAILFRNTYPELQKSIIDRTLKYYPSVGGAYVSSPAPEWRFPSGARIYCAQLDSDQDVNKYQGAEFAYIGFDELAHFSEYQYTYMISRLRSADGIPLRLRAASNPPDDDRGQWLLRRFAPWVYTPGEYTDEYAGPYAKPGERLLYARLGGQDQLVWPGDELHCPICDQAWLVPERAPPCTDRRVDHPAVHDRVFIPARLEDNPYLADDGEYAANLQQLDPLTYEQLRHGNWMARASSGMFFKKAWFKVVDLGDCPARTQWKALARYWDRAATLPSKENPDPDYTVGALHGLDRHGIEWVLDVVRCRVEPSGMEDLIRETAEDDVKEWGKRAYTVGIEVDPGSAGKFEAKMLSKALGRFSVREVPATGSKIVRAKPFSAFAKNGHVRMLRGDWNRTYITELEAFPEGGHDDQVDASSGAHSLLMTGSKGGGAKTRGKRAYASSMGGY